MLVESPNRSFSYEYFPFLACGWYPEVVAIPSLFPGTTHLSRQSQSFHAYQFRFPHPSHIPATPGRATSSPPFSAVTSAPTTPHPRNHSPSTPPPHSRPRGEIMTPIAKYTATPLAPGSSCRAWRSYGVARDRTLSSSPDWRRRKGRSRSVWYASFGCGVCGEGGVLTLGA